jgi:uncharacterized membrane protein
MSRSRASRALLAAFAATLAANGAARAEIAIEELPVAYSCSGNEPFWRLVIEGPKATYTAMGADAGSLQGSFRTLDYAGLFVYRGGDGKGGELVAFILQQSCVDTMAEAAEGGGEMPFAVGISLPGGDARIGCCRPLDAAPRANLEPLEPLVGSPGGDR